MTSVRVIRSFIGQKDCQRLTAWAKSEVDAGRIARGMTSKLFGFGLSDNRYTSRYKTSLYSYPDFVLEIRDAAREAAGVIDRPQIADHGKDGVVFNYTLPDGDLHRHKDPRSGSGELALRCNILSSAAESGGVLHVDDQPIDVNVGDLHCYFASEHWHHVTKVEGQTPRVLWMFGAYIKESEAGDIAR